MRAHERYTSSFSGGGSRAATTGGRPRTGSGGKGVPPPAIPEFTEEEYILYLEHPAWTKEDTLSLLDAVRIFDFEWGLVASTFHGDSRKTASACQKRYQQLDELVAAKRRQTTKRPFPQSKVQPHQPKPQQQLQQKKQQAKPQQHIQPQHKPQQQTQQHQLQHNQHQQAAPRHPHQRQQLHTQPQRSQQQQQQPQHHPRQPQQQPTQHLHYPSHQQQQQHQQHQQQQLQQLQQHHQQLAQQQLANGRMLGHYAPSTISIPGAGTTIFPMGAGSPFAFDPSALMRGVHTQGIPSLFTLPQALPALFPSPALHPSLASLPALPPLPSLPQSLPSMATSSSSHPAGAISGGRPQSPPKHMNHNNINVNANNSGSPARGQGQGHSSSNVPHHIVSSANVTPNGNVKRHLVNISTTLPLPSATSPTSSSSSPLSAAAAAAAAEEKRKKRRRRTASEISRNYKCEITSCTKAYGSEGALKMHIRLKHPGLRMGISKQVYARPNPLLLSSFLPLGVQSVMMGQNQPVFPTSASTAKHRPAIATANGVNGPASGLGQSAVPPQPLLPPTGVQLATPSAAAAATATTAQTVIKQELAMQVMCVPFVRLEIGGYECKSKTPGDLQAQFNFTYKRLLWEVISGGARLSINSSFDEVAGFGLEMLKDGSAVLTIEFSRPPKVAWEGNVYMQGKIAKCKRHALHFARESLNRPVEMMLKVDPRLCELANLGLPTLVDPYFDSDDSSSSSVSSASDGSDGSDDDDDDDEDGPHNLARRGPSSSPPQAQQPLVGGGEGGGASSS